MGTKGRDFVVWCFIATSLLGFITRYPAIFWLDTFFALVILYSNLEKRRAIRLKQIILVPVNRYLAMFLVFGKLKGEWNMAYEVHVEYNNLPIRLQRENIKEDLLSLRKTKDTLFLWETSTNVPSEVKKIINKLQLRGQAFWQKGFLRIPRPPLIYRFKSKKPLRHGAVLWKGRKYA